MLFRLIFLFIVVPFMELVLLLKVAEWTSPAWTILLVLVTGTVGIALARAQGFRTYSRIQTELAEGRMPTDSLLDALMILVAGALLLTPGILTDAFGLSLLIPICRRFYRAWLVHRFRSRFTVQFKGSVADRPSHETSEVIDSYVVQRHPEEDEPEEALPPE